MGSVPAERTPTLGLDLRVRWAQRAVKAQRSEGWVNPGPEKPGMAGPGA